MDDRERLLRAGEDLDAPVQVSAANGADRGTREEERADGAAQGSCGMSWSGWGN